MVKSSVCMSEPGHRIGYRSLVLRRALRVCNDEILILIIGEEQPCVRTRLRAVAAQTSDRAGGGTRSVLRGRPQGITAQASPHALALSREARWVCMRCTRVQ